jgi:oligopeptide/dipeptide ABC transporter ATP-binding protein
MLAELESSLTWSATPSAADGYGDPVLSVRNLSVIYPIGGSRRKVVHDVTFDLGAGETLGLVGESGSGKSSLVLAIARLLPTAAHTTGEVVFQGKDLLKVSNKELRKVLGAHLGVVYQDALRSLNPVMRVGSQLAELVRAHSANSETDQTVLSLLTQVGIPSAADRARLYPHEMSGGMRQRVLIAMGLGMHPQVLIADEPTTALDVTIQAQVLDLIGQLALNSGTATILVTHDMGVVAKMCDRVAVMYAGRIVEEGPTMEVFKNPRHPYTLSLLRAVPRLDTPPGAPYLVIPGKPLDGATDIQGCPFAQRCYATRDRCYVDRTSLVKVSPTQSSACLLTQSNPQRAVPQPSVLIKPVAVLTAAEIVQRPRLLEIKGLRRLYSPPHTLFGHRRGPVRAVDGVDLEIHVGEALALVGESGCGKSTFGRLLAGLERPDGGTVLHQGEDVTRLRGGALRLYRRRMQMIYQDPRSSLNRRLSIADAINEALALSGTPTRRRKARLNELFELVGLPASFVGRYPHELSGGEAQRAAIARAIALEPQLIIADEAVSSLDVSIKGQILNLLHELRRELGLTILFISHDLAVVRQVCDRAAVMYLGKLVEIGPTERLFSKPEHPYTVALRSAIPIPDPEVERKRVRLLLEGDSGNPAEPPPGCRFHTRCPVGPLKRPDRQLCREQEPLLVARSGDIGHRAACHFGELIRHELTAL